MLPSYQDIIKDTSAEIAKLRAEIPDTLRGFSAMAQGASKPGALDAKTKELVAMGIAIAARCDGCIAFHSKTALDLGTTREELMEVAGMAVYMGGGPSLMYAALALQAYDQHVEATQGA